MSLAYENNQDSNFSSSLFISQWRESVPEYLSNLHENSENITAVMMQKHPVTNQRI